MHKRSNETCAKNESSNLLSTKQELAVMAFCDGEGNPIQRLHAYLLIRIFKNQAAISFASTLRTLSLQVERVIQDDSTINETLDCSHLWERIESQIESEERALKYLRNTRRLGELGESSSKVDLWKERLIWSGGGAALASVLSFALVFSANNLSIAPSATNLNSNIAIAPQNGSTSVSLNEQIAGLSNIGTNIGGSNLFQEISNKPSNQQFGQIESPTQFQSDENFNLISQTNGSVGGSSNPRQFEVDWMRSAGRVSMIQDSKGQTALIWVKPRVKVIDPQSGLSTLVPVEPRTLARFERRPSRINRSAPSVIAINQGRNNKSYERRSTEDYDSFKSKDTYNGLDRSSLTKSSNQDLSALGFR